MERSGGGRHDCGSDAAADGEDGENSEEEVAAADGEDGAEAVDGT